MNDKSLIARGFLLRLPYSTKERATELAHQDGLSLNHFISVAVAEKIIRMDNKLPPIPSLPRQIPTKS